MAITNYHTINGRIVGQTKDGVRTHYVPDALGSVVATLDANGTVENTYRYKPYGGLLAKTGTGDDPRFLWVGSLAIAATQLRFADQQMIRRGYSSALATFLEMLHYVSSPLIEQPFTYVGGNPVSFQDPSGLYFTQKCCCCPISIKLKSAKQFTSPPNTPHVDCRARMPQIYLWGVVFELEIEFHIFNTSSKAPTTHCTAEWWERTPNPQPPFAPDQKANQFFDVFRWLSTHSNLSTPTYQQWLSLARSTPPCKDGTLILRDCPHFHSDKPKPKDTSNRIDFRVRINAGHPCQCKKPFVEWKGTWTFKLTNGVARPNHLTEVK